MSEHYKPLTCCDRDCALVNGCREGGYQCERCGRWFCSIEIDEDGFCKDCAAEELLADKEIDNEQKEEYAS